MKAAQADWVRTIEYFEDPYEALSGSDALTIVTE